MTIQDKLKIIQNLSGLTQEKLAEKLRVSFATLNSWINGKSKAHKKGDKNINDLYFLYTGQKNIQEDPLRAKKQIITDKSRKCGNVLKKIVKSTDIYDQFLLSLTYHSNKIEGSTLTEDETRAIMFDNVSLPNKNIIEQLEVKNHQAALEYLLKSLLSASFKINEIFILKLHGILMNGIRKDAGAYRNHGVRIVGTYVPTANYLKVPRLMQELTKDINHKYKDIVAHTANIHSRFEQIHPFSDGNGRVGRLLAGAMLLKNNLPPAVIEQKKKRFYNNYLRKAQLGNDFIPLENFLCDSIIVGFKVLERK
ncbi:MAG: Fic family protein [Candidatus Pacebacteria bacterium]|nr:Fic family protein [Candidatus Paceibacterota bacterium]